MGKLATNILIISMVVLTLLGVGLGTWSQLSQEKYVTEKNIVLDDKDKTQTEEMAVKLTEIIPGDKREYSIFLSALEGDAFNFTVKFEKGSEKSLAPFIDVEIFLDEGSISKTKLTELLNGQEVQFSKTFDATSKLEIKIVYSMGLDVGDEAQNTTADFNIILTAAR